MTQHIDKDALFWQAMTALKEGIEDGYIDIEATMPDFYQAILAETEGKVRGLLNDISSQYAKQGADFINQRLKSNLEADSQEFQSLSRQYQGLQQSIVQAEKRLEAFSQQQKAFKINDWVLKATVFVGFAMISLASIGILVTLTNLFGGVTLKNLWSQVYLGSFSLQDPTWQGAITVIIKLLLSALLLLLGSFVVFSPWLVFSWLLAKLPYKFRKPFDIEKYRSW